MEELRLKAYGKINLGLDVIRKREDGYHEVKMIMQTVKIYDKLTFKKQEIDEIVIKTNLDFLPTNESNLVYKAIKMLKDEYNIKTGVIVDLYKCIPVSAGMAGGSTDCAAALVGMNKLFKLGIKKKKLMEYGVKLGADVPYCILRGTALSEGIGEILTPLTPMPRCHIVIAKPPINVSTKYVYQNLKLDENMVHPDIDGMVRSIQEGSLTGITDRMGNVLETVSVTEYTIIEEIKTVMNENGAINSLMSGSGPTVFGIFEDEKLAKNCANVIRSKGQARQVYVVQPFNQNIEEGETYGVKN